MSSPIICFGQQPCGFFPKRFLVAKIRAAKRLQNEIGGEIVFFYHDSDHDPRETKTVLRHRKTNDPRALNFAFANKTQRKFSPLYMKRIENGWHEKTTLQLPNYVEHPLINIFRTVSTDNVADFCLEMYIKMELLHGVRVVRSSDPQFRKAACEISDFYVDIPYCNEIARARYSAHSSSSGDSQYDVSGDSSSDPADTSSSNAAFELHEGGDRFITLPMSTFSNEQISATRDTRLKWMQSVIHCTHYVAGASEQNYLRKEDAPEIEYIIRDTIDRSDEAWTRFPADEEGE